MIQFNTAPNTSLRLQCLVLKRSEWEQLRF